LLLIAGIVTTSWQAVRVRRVLDQVRKQKDETDRANKTLFAVNDFLTHDVLASSTPQVMLGKPLSVVEALDNASRTIAGRFGDSPVVQTRIEGVIAGAYRSLGRTDLALPHAQQAMEICKRSLSPDDRDTLSAMNELALIYFEQGRLPEAEVLQRELFAQDR